MQCLMICRVGVVDMVRVVDTILFVKDDRVRDTHECRGCVCFV